MHTAPSHDDAPRDATPACDRGNGASRALDRLARTATRTARGGCLAILRAAARRDALLRGRRLPALTTIGALAALQGCVAVGGARNTEYPTVGKQLLDLKQALDAGAISQEEFDCVKARILTEKP
jgi:hypothetical protein